MEIIEEIAKIMQSKGYCETSSYRWLCYVLSSKVDPKILEEAKEIAEGASHA